MSSFLDLPAELRNQVYGYIAIPHTAPLISHIGLYLSCRQIRSEMDSECAKIFRAYLKTFQDQHQDAHLVIPESFVEMQHFRLHVLPTSNSNLDRQFDKVTAIFHFISRAFQLSMAFRKTCISGIRRTIVSFGLPMTFGTNSRQGWSILSGLEQCPSGPQKKMRRVSSITIHTMCLSLQIGLSHGMWGLTVLYMACGQGQMARDAAKCRRLIPWLSVRA